ncbi:MAG: MMPL family transporter [Acidimicrobiia bacterium]
MALGTESMARGSARRPWLTVALWIVLIGIAGALSSQLLGDALTTSIEFTDRPESAQAQTLIDQVRGGEDDTEFVVVTSDTTSVSEPEFASFVGEIQAEVSGLSGVTSVGSFLTSDGPVAPSGKTALLPVTIGQADHDAVGDVAALVKTTVNGIDAPDAISAHVAGQATLNNDFNRISEEDLRTGEMIGVAVALVVLVFVFGTVASGVIPIILGVVSIAIAMGLAAIVGQAFDLSFFITNMITMIGLAVGIDYSLFIVSRYREERAAGFEKVDAIGRAGATATRAVFFSGMTVVLALVGMLLLPNTLFRALGIGAILVVVVAVAASLTLLPAVLSLMGDRIYSLRVRRRASLDSKSRVWDRVTRLVMGRPVVSLVLSAGILLVAASSFLSMETGLAGVSTLPDDIESKQAFEILQSEFSGGLTSPVEIVVSGEGAGVLATSLQSAIVEAGSFGPSQLDQASDAGTAILSVSLLDDVTSNDSKALVRRLRNEIIPDTLGATPVADGASRPQVFVGGETAINVDFVDQTARYTPIVFAVVLGLSFLLLLLAFRSVVIPGKAIAMNLLSVGASYGLVVAFFQKGVGPFWVKDIASFLGFGQVESIEAWLPLFMFSVLFGLSMDYHVFLLSRIKERWDQTGDNTESVAYGLRSTGALITGAAVIMVAVFAGFASGRLVSFQQMGFGLAVAVLLDATIVRTVLVPASMKLLGRWNWYLPSWLEWLPNVSVEGHLEDVPGRHGTRRVAA